MPQAIQILSYATDEQPVPAPLASRVVALLISLPAIAVVFLDFAYETSPLDVVLALVRWDSGSAWQLACEGIPFFLAFVLFWISVRQLVWSGISRGERVIFWVTIAGAALATLMLNGLAISEIVKYGTDELNGFLYFTLPILLGGGLLVFLRRKQLARGEAQVCALYVAYLANAAICLIGYAGHADVGWYFAVPVAALMLLHLAWLLFFRRKLRLSASA